MTEGDVRKDAARGLDRLAPVRLLGIAAGVMLLAALVLAFLQWQRVQDLEVVQGELKAMTMARDTAADFMQLLFTYSHENFEEHEQEVLAAATNRFEEFYTSSLDSGTRQSVLSTEAVSTASVQGAWVAEPEGGDVSVIVVLDTDNVSLLGRRQLQGAWFRVRLESRDGTWLVDEFTNVVVEDEIFDPANGEGAPTESPGSPSPSPDAGPTS